jgi:hypothetical protein
MDGKEQIFFQENMCVTKETIDNLSDLSKKTPYRISSHKSNNPIYWSYWCVTLLYEYKWINFYFMEVE